MVDRILSVTTTDSRRGAEVFAVDLASELQRNAVDVEVVALTAGSGEHRLEIDVLGQSRRGPGTIRALRSRLKTVDLVIANGSTTLPITALSTLGSGVPFIYRNVGDPWYWATTRGRRLRTAWALRRAAAVVALTGDTALALHECYGIPSAQTLVIPKAAPGWKFPPTDDGTRASRRRELGLPDGPVVLYAGALSEEKRPDLAIEVTAEAKSNPTLVLAGDGQWRSLAQSAAADLLPGRVHFVGQVRDLSPYLQAADVLLLPSDTEGLPGVAIEAGMTGIPVVATDVGWIREIVLDGRTGFLVPRGSVLELAKAVDKAIEQRHTLGPVAREHCLAHFDIEQVARQWLDLVQSTVRRASPTRVHPEP